MKHKAPARPQPRTSELGNPSLHEIDRLLACAMRGGLKQTELYRWYGFFTAHKTISVSAHMARLRRIRNLKRSSALTQEQYKRAIKQARTRKELASLCGMKSTEGLRKWERKHGLR